MPDQTARLYWIDAQIRADHYPNAQDVSDFFPVTKRTAYEDRNRLLELGAPLVFDRNHQGWKYTDPTFMLPFLALSEPESATLRRSLLAAQEYLGPADAHIAGQLFTRLAPYLPGASLAETFGSPIHLTSQAQASAHLLATCRQAVHNRQRLRLRYYSAHRDEITHRIVQPYHLHTFQGEAHLIAWCEWRQDFRQFFLGRMQEYELLEGERAFTRREDFDVEAYLQEGLNLQHGKERVTVRARFSPYQARWMRERQFHASQQCEELPDGGLILTLQVAGTEEARRWLLAYGSEAEALEPPELRAAIEAELKKLQKIYSRTRQ